jgi:hypothetical protein
METLILGWYVLVESGSVVQLTLFGALMFVGTLLSPLLGTLGDRLGLRRVLATHAPGYALLAGVILCWCHAAGSARRLVLAVAFRGGPDQAVGHRHAHGAGQRHGAAAQLVAAMGISRTTQDSARIGGALAGAGFMASLGMARPMGSSSSLYVRGRGAHLALRRPAMRHRPPAGTGRPRAARRPGATCSKACSTCGTRRVLRAAMSLAALVNLCVFPLSGGLMPYIARDVFMLDQRAWAGWWPALPPARCWARWA